MIRSVAMLFLWAISFVVGSSHATDDPHKRVRSTWIQVTTLSSGGTIMTDVCSAGLSRDGTKVASVFRIDTPQKTSEYFYAGVLVTECLSDAKSGTLAVADKDTPTNIRLTKWKIPSVTGEDAVGEALCAQARLFVYYKKHPCPPYSDGVIRKKPAVPGLINMRF